MSRLTRADRWLLWGLVPAYLFVLALHAHEVMRTGLAQLPVYAQWVPGDYPRVAGYRMETDSSGSGLEPGDRLLRVGDRDLRGAGYVGFHAAGLARTRPGEPVALTIERDGERITLPLEARPHVPSWSRLPVLVMIPTICVLLLLRAPGSPTVQRFCLAFLAYGLPQAAFYGGPEWQSWLAALVWNVGTPLAMFAMIHWCIHFPDEMPDEGRAWRGLPWVATALYVVFVRSAYFLPAPFSTAWVPRVSMASHGLAMLLAMGIVTWNYFQAHPIGRRRVRWILLGATLGSAPMVVAALVPLLVPGWRGFAEAHAIGYLATIIWMLSVVVAVSLENAFDVDRLIGATATWGLASGAAVALLAVLVPTAASSVSLALGVEEGSVRLVFAAVLGALVVPTGLWLRSRMDRIFFPGRVAQQEAAERAFDELGHSGSTAELLDRLARKIQELVRPAGLALYVREETGYLRRRATLATAPPELPLGLALPSRVGAGNAPAELRRVGVELLVPVRGEREPAAVVCLAAKASGDVYTSADVGILATLVGKAGAEWLRFAKALSDRESRAKTNLLAAASHDLRQPLHAVGLLSEALEAQLGDEETRKLNQQIGSSTRDLEEMLATLLDHSRLDAGAVAPAPRDVALAELFSRLAQEAQPPAEAKGLRLRVVPTRLAVRSDPLLLIRVLRNLVSNAIRYTERGAVLVAARRRGGQVAIEVRDSGPGIPEAAREEIFRAFRQLPGGHAQGLGLGLSIVDGLCRLLGHDLELRSEPGIGSTFTVRVPEAAEVPVPERTSGHGQLRGARVLVLDDVAAEREPVLLLLREWGCEAREAGSLEAGRVLLREAGWRPDFVVSDFHLGEGLEGPDAVAALREELGNGLHAAILTSETDTETLAGVRAAGLPVLRKPVRAAQLRAVLAAAFSSRTAVEA